MNKQHYYEKRKRSYATSRLRKGRLYAISKLHGRLGHLTSLNREINHISGATLTAMARKSAIYGKIHAVATVALAESEILLEEGIGYCNRELIRKVMYVKPAFKAFVDIAEQHGKALHERVSLLDGQYEEGGEDWYGVEELEGDV